MAWLQVTPDTAPFVEHCQRHGLRVLQYAEQPQGHWYPGSRCGIARAQPAAAADAATRGP